MDKTLVAILGYVLAQLALGAFVSRRVRTEEDYLLGGRRLGYGLATFSIFATWFGAETCIGAAGAVYERGLSGTSADPFGYGLCILLMGLVYAVPLWRLRLTTPADFFRLRFGAAVERVVVLLMIPTSLFWAAAQIRAFGQVLSASSGWGAEVTITAAAIVVIVYTSFGGLLADAWTDVVQGVALCVGLLVLLGFILNEHGTGLFAAVPHERKLLFAGDASLLEVLERWAIPVFGSVTAAELVTRAIAARSPQVARRSALVACSLYVLIGLVPVWVGLIGPQLVAGLEHPEHILPRIAQSHLPDYAYPLFAGAVVSAILSTVDSNLLVSASLLSHNVLVPLRPALRDATKVRLARGAVVGFGVIAYFLALHADAVYALVEAASAFGSAGIFVVMTLGLFTRQGQRLAALAALFTGVGVWCVGSYGGLIRTPYLASLGAAFAAYGLAAVFERLRRARHPSAAQE